MIDSIPVIDAVVHPYNFAEDNFRNHYANAIADMVSGSNRATSPEGYRLTKEAYDRNWSIEEVANMTFCESYADLAAYHVVPIRAFYDGICSVEKAVEAKQRWPQRFFFYAGVDPLEGQKAIDDLEEQYELLDGPVGLKLYPNSWVGDQVRGWLMDDPEVAYPVFRRAQELGIRVVAVHKALPLGPVEMLHYKVTDIDRAAIDFPALNFEIVHGGISFLEETAWQIQRFPNVYVNLETTATLATIRPGAFELAMATLGQTPKSREKIMWGTGCMVAHPRPHVERFARFQFSNVLLDGGLAPLTTQDKRNIFAENYARLHHVDLADRLAATKGDHFDRRTPGEADRADPYSLTEVAHLVS